MTRDQKRPEEARRDQKRPAQVWHDIVFLNFEPKFFYCAVHIVRERRDISCFIVPCPQPFFCQSPGVQQLYDGDDRWKFCACEGTASAAPERQGCGLNCAFSISKGDLDGDLYFICWDERSHREKAFVSARWSSVLVVFGLVWGTVSRGIALLCAVVWCEDPEI